MLEWKDVLAALTTLVASFAGAWAAFKFQTLEKDAAQNEKEVGAGNRAIYAVYALWNVLEQFRKEVLEPHRDTPGAWLNLAAHPAPPVQVDRFQSSDLQFLLERGHADVFAALMLEEQRFNLAIDLIKSRSDLVLKRVFPLMGAAGFKVGKPQTLGDIENALGEDVCHQLKELTAMIYQNVDEDLASLLSLYTQLRQALQAMFPARKFVRVVFEEPPKAANVGTAVE
jgi:hypothetical protein